MHGCAELYMLRKPIPARIGTTREPGLVSLSKPAGDQMEMILVSGMLRDATLLRRWAAAALLCAAPALPAADAPAKFNIVYVGPNNVSALLGVQQGLSEANLQGSFLGQVYELAVVAPAEFGADRIAGALAVIVAGDETVLERVREPASGMPVFNVVLDADALRSACHANVLHIAPSRAMKDDAERQWLKAHADRPATAAAWHADFEKYAARDLNKRFRKAFDRPMDDAAWAGWAAVKMASDSVAREGIRDGGALLAYLRSSLSFDGQKGVDMSFRDTGQLRQPLLLVRDGKIAGEAPVRGVAGADDLDSLGLQSCAR
jgi:hypothetical protein